jgi:hypothetical protein
MIYLVWENENGERKTNLRTSATAGIGSSLLARRGVTDSDLVLGVPPNRSSVFGQRQNG